MNISRNTVLIIDSILIKKLDILSLLSPFHYDLKVILTMENALLYLKKHSVSVVISAIDINTASPYQLLSEVKSLDTPPALIYFCEQASISDAVTSIKNGADYFFDEHFDKPTLFNIIDDYINNLTPNKKVLSTQTIKPHHMTNNIIHIDPKMQDIISTIDQVAITKATVLLLGESGVGKEVLAKMIHKKSPRKNKRFVVINCAAIPETLIESELFGHERGSFTGANYKKIGKFEQAQGGTIFLDELGELSLDMQVKFLRVLQERQLERVGGSESIEIDVRVIAATNRDLLEELDKGTFREDLYYRLNVVNINIPPLRERKKEIPALATLFINEFSKDYNKQLEFMDIETMQILMEHTWKGNVRELRNVIERATVVAKKDEQMLMSHHLPAEITKNTHLAIGRCKTELTLKEYEQMIILYTLDKVNGSKSKTAGILNIQRQTLYNKLKEYETKTPTAPLPFSPIIYKS